MSEEEIKEFINEEGEVLSREEVVEELGKEAVNELEKEGEDEIGHPLSVEEQPLGGEVEESLNEE